MNRITIALLAALLVSTSGARGQEPTLKRLEARVTATSAGIAHIDVGGSAGVQVGDRVVFQPTGAPVVDGTVRSVTATTARVQLRDPAVVLDPGTLCEIQVPANRSPAGPGQAPKMTAIAARCTTSAKGVATIDHGCEAGVAVGDAVVFRPKDGDQVTGKVLSVEDRKARVELGGGVESLPRGTRCDVIVPRERVQALKAKNGKSGHAGANKPRWTRPPEEWDQSKPLLAEPRALKPEERKEKWRGRVYLMVDALLDNERSKRESYTNRAGVDVEAENLFGNGGTLHLDAEVNYLATLLPDQSSESDARLRLDRLSYTWGGTRERTQRWTVGRFLQNEFPEFGVVDGAEYTYRLDNGDRVGASLGFMPEPDLDYDTGEDFQAAVYYRYILDEAETLSLGGGFQKTFNDWETDRDLLLASARWHPGNGLDLFATAWVDFYGSDDDAKDSAVELTEMHANASYRFDSGDGVMLTFTHIRFPELKRNEFDTLPADTLNGHHNERISLRGWHGLTDRIRLSARADFWTDQDDSGGGGEVRADFRRLFIDEFSADVTVFGNDARFTSVIGFRMHGSLVTDFGLWNLFWETAVYDRDNLGNESLWQHRVRLSWDKMLANGLSASVYIEQRFGDDQNTLNLGVYLQYNF